MQRSEVIFDNTNYPTNAPPQMTTKYKGVEYEIFDIEPELGEMCADSNQLKKMGWDVVDPMIYVYDEMCAANTDHMDFFLAYQVDCNSPPKCCKRVYLLLSEHLR